MLILFVHNKHMVGWHIPVKTQLGNCALFSNIIHIYSMLLKQMFFGVLRIRSWNREKWQETYGNQNYRIHWLVTTMRRKDNADIRVIILCSLLYVCFDILYRSIFIRMDMKRAINLSWTVDLTISYLKLERKRTYF